MKRILSRIPFFRKPSITPRPAFIAYLVLIAVAIVYTQMLRSPASSLFFWFLLFLPVISVLYLLVAKMALKVYVDADRTTTEKMTPLTYELKIINEFIFPFARVEAMLSLPDEDGVRCSETRMDLSLIPLGTYAIREDVQFPYRGTYLIGVKELVVSDFLYLFRLRIDVDIFHSILVLPRRLRTEHDSVTSATDVPTDNARVVQGAERSEIGDIRSYQSGDSLKSIHWKLSSKTQDLQVKQFNTNTARSVYVLCDFSRSPEGAYMPAEEETVKKETVKKEKKHVKLRKKGEKPFKEAMEKAREKYAAVQYRRRRQSGMSKNKADDIESLDTLIRETALPNAFQRKMMELRERRAEKNPPVPEKPEETAEEIPEEIPTIINRAASITDGTLKPEYAEDMDEYCADGVVEMAIAAVQHELRSGNSCTLLWFDSREESGVCSAELTSLEDFESIYTRFATTPNCPADETVTRLTLLVRESLNVTLRIATSHLDEEAMSRYGSVPAMFGGAGTGCVTEILLFNPESRYSDLSVRREYVEMCRDRLAQDGILLSELRPGVGSDGTPTLTLH